MAKTKKKRRRKHRGTQSGAVARRTTGRPQSREQAKAQATRRREEKLMQPPTWRGALGKGGLAAFLFFIVFGLLLRQSIGQSLIVGVFMLFFYVPLSYYVDGFMYRRRLRKAEGGGA